MAQFDVYANTNSETNDRVPYLLDVQHEILDALHTKMIVPLVLDMKPITHLNPYFSIHSIQVIMSTSEMAGVPIFYLGDKVDSLASERNTIISAIDFMITGF